MAFQPANFLLQGVSGTVFGAISTVPTPAVITSDGGGPTADVSVSTGDTAVTTVTADGTGTEIFSISGGAEALMFTINSGSGALAFTTTSVDGVYEVIVKATNDWGSDTQTITVTVGGAPAYEGPLDLVPGALVGYGMRALSADMIGENIIRLRRDSDDAELDFVAGVDGSLDAAAVTTWLGGSDGFVVTWYDQSGNNHHLTQASAASQPQWLANQIGGIPSILAVAGSGGSLIKDGDTFAFSTGQATGFLVGFNDSSAGNINFAESEVGNGVTLQPGTTGYIYIDDGASNTAGGEFDTANPGNGIWEFVGSQGANAMLFNGANLGEDADYDGGGAVGAISQTKLFLVFVQDTNIVKSGRAEVIVWPSVVSAGNRLAVRENEATYYGITI